MKLLLLFALLACSSSAFGMIPSHVLIAASPMNRVIRPDTPANRHLLQAIEAGDLTEVQAALQAGANPDAEAGWEIPAIDVPPSPARTFANPRSFTELASQDSSQQHDRCLPIFHLLLHSLPVSSFTRPEKEASLMCSAVVMNDLESVRWLVARGVSVNPPPSGEGILSLALFQENMRVKTVSPLTAFLLDHGAEVNTVDLTGATPLMIAAQYGKTGVVRALLAHGADPALRDKQGRTALDWASMRGQDDAVALLRDRSPMNISEAAQFGDVVRLRAHLDAGEDPNSSDASGTTPLMKAAESGSLPTLRLLLARGANVNQKRKDSTAALHLAAVNGYTSVCALLLNRGADINAVGKNIRTVDSLLDGQFTPLMCAVLTAQADTVALLVKRGASLKQGEGEAALDATVRDAGEGALLRPVKTPKGRHLHGDAAGNARMRIIDLLLDAGVSLRSKNSHALFLAADAGQAGLVEYFLARGADVNEHGEIVPDKSMETEWNSGETALMGAIEAWDKADVASLDIKPSKGDQDSQSVVSAQQSVHLLLAHGADVNLPNAYQSTPLMLCVSLDQPTIAEALLARGAKIDATDRHGKTALMQAVRQRRPYLVPWLLAHHAGVNRRDKLGRTALMDAIDDGTNNAFRTRATWAWAKYDNAGHSISFDGKPHPVPQKDLPNPEGHPDVVRLLLSHGAYINAVALNGATALSLARKENFGSVITMLQNAGARR